MKITVLPPGPEPKQHTASCREMRKLLRHSVHGDLTYDQRARSWQSWDEPLNTAPFEDRLKEAISDALRRKMK